MSLLSLYQQKTTKSYKNLGGKVIQGKSYTAGCLKNHLRLRSVGTSIEKQLDTDPTGTQDI